MIKVFGNNEHNSSTTSHGIWLELTNPNFDEVNQVAQMLDLSQGDLTAAMDLNEKNRFEKFNAYTLIIIDIPTKSNELDYKSIPLGIILIGKHVITVCYKENQILNKFHESYEHKYASRHKVEFIYAILLETTIEYQRALLSINKVREELEHNVKKIKDETELISLHKLEVILVHFFFFIMGNATVITKMIRYSETNKISDGKDLLDNIFIENQQNLEMAQIYREIISSTRELFSSIMESRLNNVMKRLTSITVILSIPTIISGIYGMNLNPLGMPFSQIANGFTILISIITLTCVLLAALLKIKKLI